jgi:hypothetical protein
VVRVLVIVEDWWAALSFRSGRRILDLASQLRRELGRHRQPALRSYFDIPRRSTSSTRQRRLLKAFDALEVTGNRFCSRKKF